MLYRLLEWDSQFFGRRISSLNLSSDDRPSDVLSFLRNQKDYDLCYVFCPSNNKSKWEKLGSIGGMIVDQKVSFEKWLDSVPQAHLPDFIRELNSMSLAAEELAVQSGWKSRFKRDPHLAAMQPELYRRWLLKDLESTNAKVFGYFVDERLVGLACSSVELEKRRGKLDLISVEKAYAGLGIGGKLIQAVEQYWKRENCVEGYIVTQQDNEAAMSFYKKNGYVMVSIQEVWHVWRIIQ